MTYFNRRGKGSIPGQAWFFFRIFFNRYVVHYTAEITFTVIVYFHGFDQSLTQTGL